LIILAHFFAASRGLVAYASGKKPDFPGVPSFAFALQSARLNILKNFQFFASSVRSNPQNSLY
jgi:hypothetical protein